MTKEPSSKVAPPVVSFKEEEAGRETLTAIAEDRLAALSGVTRGPATTKHYGDRISNAPGATSPKTARAMDTAPEVSISMGRAGRETYALIAEDHKNETPEIVVAAAGRATYALIEEASSSESPDIEISIDDEEDLPGDEWMDALEIEQVYTFVVNASPEQIDSTEQRFRLVERRLLTQMPGCTLDQIVRIEVNASPKSAGVLVTVWVRLLE